MFQIPSTVCLCVSKASYLCLFPMTHPPNKMAPHYNITVISSCSNTITTNPSSAKRVLKWTPPVSALMGNLLLLLTSLGPSDEDRYRHRLGCRSILQAPGTVSPVPRPAGLALGASRLTWGSIPPALRGPNVNHRSPRQIYS